MKDIFDTVFVDKNKLIEELSNYYKEVEIFADEANEIKKHDLIIENINNKKEKLLELVITGNIQNDEFEKRNNKYNELIFELELKINDLKHQQLITNANISDVDKIKNEIKEQLEFKDSIYEVVNSFIEEIIVSKIHNNRKNIKLDIFLNFNKKERKERGSKYIENIRNHAPLTRNIASIEKGNRNMELNKFKYDIYINGL